MKNYKLKTREKVNTFIFWYKSIKVGCFIWQTSSQYSKTTLIIKFHSATRHDIEGEKLFYKLNQFLDAILFVSSIVKASSTYKNV